MMTKSCLLTTTITVLLAFGGLHATAQDPGNGLSNAWDKVREESKRAFVVGKVKAAFADRKDIPGRYIRVRFDGHILQLAGFLPNKDVAKAAEALAREVGKPDTVQTFWAFDEAIDNRDAYKTFVGEQTSDIALDAKVLASVNGPAVRPQFKHAEIVHVNVNHGTVTVYIVADAAPDTFTLDPYVTPIPGVTEFHYRVVKAY